MKRPFMKIKAILTQERRIKMATIYFIILILISLQSAYDAKLYKIVVHTGSSWNAGTGDYVTVIIYGTNGSVRDRFNGFGTRFEKNDEDHLEINGDDIGSVRHIEVQFSKHGIFLDDWQLDKVEINVDGDSYVGYFDYKYTRNGEAHYARQFDVISCRSGYYASEMPDGRGKTCVDRNECLTTCKSKSEKCTNTPGGYICECAAGYRSDGFGCIDVDECTELGKNPCDHKHTYCANLPGSYECKCEKGYIGDYYSCQDKNECQMNIDQCTQNCNNTEGSYKCSCKKGFKLAVDGRTCLDVDECSNPNPCNKTSSECYDEYGSYRCVCRTGYKAHPTKPNICIPQTCTPPEIKDSNIILSPTRCSSGKSTFGDECTVYCKAGFYLDPLSAKTLKCGNGPLNGFERVQGAIPKCKPKLCSAITPPTNAYTVPSHCSKSGTEQDKDCYIYCDGEFILAGQRRYHCSMEKYDKDPSNALCTKIPKIKCPQDITRVLPPDQATMAIGNSYPNFETNMIINQVSSNIPGVGPSYKFKPGLTIVKYTATNELNQTDSCSFAVTIRDQTSPVVEYCPDDQYLVSKAGVDLKMEWNEPRFKDNVGIKLISQNARSGEIRPPTTLDVSYTAIDHDGNRNSCNFKIHVKVLTCDFDSIGGGDQLIQKRCVSLPGFNAICMAHCPFGKTFNIINSKGYLKYMWNCAKADFGIKRMPDCVDFIKKNGTCQSGYVEAKNYRVFGLPTVCGKCPRGTYYTNGTCIDCPVNTYQDIEGALSCKKCPPNKGSITSRNIFETACKELCPPGYISQTGISDLASKCTMCPVNTYSVNHGATECMKCPNGTTTEGPGRTTINDCFFGPRNVTMIPSGTINATDGDTVQFDCYASGNPLPSILIGKEKGDQNPTTHGLITVGNTPANIKGLRYIISPVSKYDADTYVCRAENKKGIVYKQIKLIVNDAPIAEIGS